MASPDRGFLVSASRSFLSSCVSRLRWNVWRIVKTWRLRRQELSVVSQERNAAGLSVHTLTKASEKAARTRSLRFPPRCVSSTLQQAAPPSVLVTVFCWRREADLYMCMCIFIIPRRAFGCGCCAMVEFVDDDVLFVVIFPLFFFNLSHFRKWILLVCLFVCCDLNSSLPTPHLKTKPRKSFDDCSLKPILKTRHRFLQRQKTLRLKILVTSADYFWYFIFLR